MKSVTLLIISIASLGAFGSPKYYPAEKLKLIHDKQVTLEDKKEHLRDILSQVHLIDDAGNHTLARTCDGQSKCLEHRSVGYRTARKYLFGKLHLRTGTNQNSNQYFVKGVYCNSEFTNSTPGVGRIGPMKVPNANKLNCEHTWPQSKFNGSYSKGMQKSDLHHLFPTNSRANSMRGNYPFGEVDTEIETMCNSVKLGNVGGDFRTYYFQPPANHRGNVARALFYFSIRYDMPLKETQEAFLRKWHIADPVDDEERARNNEIMKIQGNRNPFIDMPDLVSRFSDF
jgi:deoxyribonuclease-1